MESNIKVFEKIGKNPGKSVVVMAGLHGNEVCGVKAFNELLPEIEIDNGKVTFIYANLEAQRQNKRFVEYNLNRCFFDEQPEDMKDTLEGRTAREIMPYLEEADILLDIHSSKSSGNLRFIFSEENSLDLVSVLSPDKVIMDIDNTHPGSADGYTCNLGKLGICIECGLHESEESAKVAKESIFRFLKKTGNISGEPDEIIPKKIFRADYLYKNKNGPFRLAGEFRDFDEISERTLIGYDGDEKIYIEAGDVLMFPDEPEEIGGECFMVIREETLLKDSRLESGEENGE